jgi:hypothetical protein
MGKLVILPDLLPGAVLRVWGGRLVSFTGKARQTLIIHIDPPRVKASDQDIYSEVELESINKKRVGNVLADDALLVDGHLRYVIDDVDALALRGILRLDDPLVVLDFLRLQLMKVRVEVSEFIRKYVGVGNDVEFILTELVLHLHHVIAQSVLSGELIGLREMINFLIVAQPLILVQLQGLAGPQDVPVVVALGLKEAVVL